MSESPAVVVVVTAANLIYHSSLLLRIVADFKPPTSIPHMHNHYCR